MKKEKLYLFQGIYFNGDEPVDYLFVSNGTRKNMDEEFRDFLNIELGFEVDRADIQGVYKQTEVYDYTTKKLYKISLIPKK